MKPSLLTAIDGSQQRHHVLRHAIAWAGRLNAGLHVVSVLDLTHHWEMGLLEASPDMVEILERETTQILEEAAQSLRQSKIDGRTYALTGLAAEQIVAHAQRIDAQMIIIGHRQLSWLGRMVAQSVGLDLLAHSPCDVLIVPDQQSDIRANS